MSVLGLRDRVCVDRRILFRQQYGQQGRRVYDQAGKPFSSYNQLWSELTGSVM